ITKERGRALTEDAQPIRPSTAGRPSTALAITGAASATSLRLTRAKPGPPWLTPAHAAARPPHLTRPAASPSHEPATAVPPPPPPRSPPSPFDQPASPRLVLGTAPLGPRRIP